MTKDNSAGVPEQGRGEVSSTAKKKRNRLSLTRQRAEKRRENRTLGGTTRNSTALLPTSLEKQEESPCLLPRLWLLLLLTMLKI